MIFFAIKTNKIQRSGTQKEEMKNGEWEKMGRDDECERINLVRNKFQK